MTPRSEHPVPVHRRRERDGLPVNDRRLRRLVDAGAFVRVVAGSYVAGEDWATLKPIDRHLMRVLETASRLRSEVVFSHSAAAAVWGIDRLGSWPVSVDVRIERSSGGRSSGGIRRRSLGLDGVSVVPWLGHHLTDPAQTAVDLAGLTTFTSGVVMLDQALWRRRKGGALAEMPQLQARVDRAGGRGSARAARAVSFATALSDSVRESQSRVLIDALGFPAPTLQRPFELRDGRSAEVDFFFEGFDLIGEFDGVGKYLDPALLRGRTPEQALIAEKDRGDELARMVRRLSRWRTPALDDPRRLYDMLSKDGLLSVRPRPRVGQRWE